MPFDITSEIPFGLNVPSNNTPFSGVKKSGTDLIPLPLFFFFFLLPSIVGLTAGFHSLPVALIFCCCWYCNCFCNNNCAVEVETAAEDAEVDCVVVVRMFGVPFLKLKSLDVITPLKAFLCFTFLAFMISSLYQKYSANRRSSSFKMDVYIPFARSTIP